jgi:hypothetical protein
MRYFYVFILPLAILWANSAFATSFRGYVFLAAGNYYFSDEVSLKSFLIEPADETVRADLLKLKSFDTLIGTASLSSKQTMILESIDFVALRRLVGVWRGSQSLVNFSDLSRVSIYFHPTDESSSYRYALAPADGNSWRIFFSDQSSVVLGDLEVQESEANIQLYDSQTGELTRTLYLKKISR